MTEGQAAGDVPAAEPVTEYACTVEIRVLARSVTEARIKLDRAISVSYRLDAITPAGGGQ